jgi:hypothetical protein
VQRTSAGTAGSGCWSCRRAAHNRDRPSKAFHRRGAHQAAQCLSGTRAPVTTTRNLREQGGSADTSPDHFAASTDLIGSEVKWLGDRSVFGPAPMRHDRRMAARTRRRPLWQPLWQRSAAGSRRRKRLAWPRSRPGTERGRRAGSRPDAEGSAALVRRRPLSCGPRARPAGGGLFVSPARSRSNRDRGR